jgi:hypothetical protein
VIALMTISSGRHARSRAARWMMTLVSIKPRLRGCQALLRSARPRPLLSGVSGDAMDAPVDRRVVVGGIVVVVAYGASAGPVISVGVARWRTAAQAQVTERSDHDKDIYPVRPIGAVGDGPPRPSWSCSLMRYPSRWTPVTRITHHRT